MTVYVFDNTLDGLLTAVFDSFFLKQQPEYLLAEGDQLPLFADEPHHVITDSEHAERVWKGLEKYLSKDGMRMISVSWQSEERTLNQPLFNFICKVFRLKVRELERNASDPDVLEVRNSCRRVLHEQLRMKQFIRFRKLRMVPIWPWCRPITMCCRSLSTTFKTASTISLGSFTMLIATTDTITMVRQPPSVSPLRMRLPYHST